VRRLLALGVLVCYAATGLTIVRQDEVGVVRRCGAVLAEPWGPGLHWGFPWGIDRIDRVQTGQTRVLTIGARDNEGAPLTAAPNPETDDFLTGDLNVVTARAIVQYRVSDPVKYLFTARSCDRILKAAAESALTRALTGNGVDDVLTTGRGEIAEATRRAIQEQADGHALGVSIRAVRLGRVAPPTPVAPAFADAARARSDRRQVITRAEEYRDRAQADARGRAREIADQAAGRYDSLVQNARGEADRFTLVLAESKKNAEATRRRLYLETLAELFPRFRRKVIVAPGEELDLGLFAEEENTSSSSTSALPMNRNDLSIPRRDDRGGSTP
jgi:membrane protease subunit HflK